MKKLSAVVERRIAVVFLESGPRFVVFIFFPEMIRMIFIPLLRRRGGYIVLALSVTNIFHCIFLSNHASQPLQTWYGAEARGPTWIYIRQLSTSCFMSFFTFRHNMVKYQTFVALFSATMHHSHFTLGMVLQLGVLHVAYRIHVRQLSTSCFMTFIFYMVWCQIFVALCRGILIE